MALFLPATPLGGPWILDPGSPPRCCPMTRWVWILESGFWSQRRRLPRRPRALGTLDPGLWMLEWSGSCGCPSLGFWTLDARVLGLLARLESGSWILEGPGSGAASLEPVLWILDPGCSGLRSSGSQGGLDPGSSIRPRYDLVCNQTRSQRDRDGSR